MTNLDWTPEELGLVARKAVLAEDAGRNWRMKHHAARAGTPLPRGESVPVPRSWLLRELSSQR